MKVRGAFEDFDTDMDANAPFLLYEMEIQGNVVCDCVISFWDNTKESFSSR